MAFTTLCQDDLDHSTTPSQEGEGAVSTRRNRREPLLMVMADGPLTEASDCEQGPAILAGPRVGPDDRLVRCSGRTETITVSGKHITNLGSASAIRPALRSAVLARHDGCTIDGCNSVYRLEVHHVVDGQEAGITSPKSSPPCAGGTTTSPSTDKVCVSTPIPHPEEDGCYAHGEPAATTCHPPTSTRSPYSEPSSPQPTEPHPEHATANGYEPAQAGQSGDRPVQRG